MLNLKDEIIIDGANHNIEIWGIKQGAISSLKLDGCLFTRSVKDQSEGQQMGKPKKDIEGKPPIESQRWTIIQDQILTEQYPFKTVPTLIKQYFPDKIPRSIYERTNELGLRKYKRHKGKKPKEQPREITTNGKLDETTIKNTDWSHEEEEFLRDNFFKFGIETIIRDNLLTSKTEEQIRAKVKFMGLVLG